MSTRRTDQSVSQLFHGPAPRSPLHRLAVRLRHSRSNTSTEYSLPGATQLSQVRSTISLPADRVFPAAFCPVLLGLILGTLKKASAAASSGYWLGPPLCTPLIRATVLLPFFPPRALPTADSALARASAPLQDAAWITRIYARLVADKLANGKEPKEARRGSRLGWG